MSRFTDAETVLQDDGILLLTPLTYELFFKGSGLMVQAPKGFWSDGVSFPGWFPAWLKTWVKSVMPIDRMLRSAVVHDLARRDLRWRKYQGDYAFWEAMGVDKVPPFWRTVATLAVMTNTTRR
jgi:hypothetical protein